MNGQMCSRCNAKDSLIIDYYINGRVCQNCGEVYEEEIIKSSAHENNTDEGEADPAINDTIKKFKSNII